MNKDALDITINALFKELPHWTPENEELPHYKPIKFTLTIGICIMYKYIPIKYDMIFMTAFSQSFML